jgi:uncharacterized membrane protein YdbT with pleckstrin-like domain
MSVVDMILGWFGVSRIRLFLWTVVVVIVAAAVWQGYSLVWRRGWNSAMTTISKVNEAAALIARETQTTVDGCWDNGGEWNVSTGSCDK